MVLSIGNGSLGTSIGIQLGKHNKNLLLYSQRMATGLKINSAADNAANLSLSTQVQKTINAAETLKNNAETGLDLLSTAESDLNEITKMLQRMRDLSVQGLNGVYSTEEKAMLMDEVNQLGAEIKRITQTCAFGDKNIFVKDVDNPVEILVSDSGEGGSIRNEDYMSLDSISDDMLFADVLAKDSNVFMLNMAPGQTDYVSFDNKIYLLTNTSSESRNLIYGYKENLADEDKSIEFVQDFEGITSTYVDVYKNTQTQMGGGQSYINVAGGDTINVTLGTSVYSLTNSGSTTQTAIFNSGGIISGQGLSETYQFDLSPYNTALGNETAVSLNGSQTTYVSYSGNLYTVTNNSATQETLVYRGFPMTILSGNVNASLVGGVSTPTGLNNNIYNETLSPSQRLYYENSGNYYEILNNTGQPQSFLVNLTNNNIQSPNASVTRTAINPITDTTVSSMTNPVVLNVVAGQKYYLEDTVGHNQAYEITASATGKLILDYDGQTITGVGGVGATVDTYPAGSGDYERLFPDAGGGYKFTIDFTNNQDKVINLYDEIYTISNAGSAKPNRTFTWDPLAHTITQDVPNPQITVDGYMGNLASPSGINSTTDSYLSSLANGASRYLEYGGDVFRVTNSSGTNTDAIMTYNSGAHTLSTATGGITATRINEATFTQDNPSEYVLGFAANQVRRVQFGSDIFTIQNTTANPKNLIFTYGAGVLTPNDATVAANFSFSQATVTPGTAMNAGDIYTTINNTETRYISSGGMYFNITNSSGARTAVFRQSGADLTQIGGTGVSDSYFGNESYESLSNVNDYYIEMGGSTTQYIKLGNNTYRLSNSSGETKTTAFRQVGTTFISQNPYITGTYIPISNQDDFTQMLPVVDWALNVVTDKRSQIGSKMASIEQTIEMNNNKKISLSAANSTLIDADIAQERSEYLKTQILSNFTSLLFNQSKNMNRDLVLNLLKS